MAEGQKSGYDGSPDQKIQAAHPPATSGGDPESAAAVPSADLRRKNRIKLASLIALAIVVNVTVFVTLDLTFRTRNPKFRLSSVAIDGLSFTNATASSPSFNVSFDAVYAVKNPNFGPFKYLDTYITFSYRGNRVGEVRVTEAKAKAWSTKKVGFKVSVSSRAVLKDPNLGRDVGSGLVGLSVGSELRGQVEFLKVIKKDRTPEMSCTMVVNLGDKVVQDLKCV